MRAKHNSKTLNFLFSPLDEDIGTILKNFLKKLGCSITVSQTVEDFLRLTEENRWAFLVVDVSKFSDDFVETLLDIICLDGKMGQKIFKYMRLFPKFHRRCYMISFLTGWRMF